MNTSTTKLTALILFLFIGIANVSAQGFTIAINADNGVVGESVQSSDCQKYDEEVFTHVASGTFYTDVESYSGGKSLEINIEEGSTGWGSFGGMIKFPNCTHVGGRNLVKGDEIWVRLRIKLPSNFTYNTGANKFIRFRTFHMENGSKVSDGYNDLYMDGNQSLFRYIYEGFNGTAWYHMQDGEFLDNGVWHTVELYLSLDDQTASEGGDAMVRVWLDGNLIGETNDHNTLKFPDSFIDEFKLFTWWGGNGATVTQRLWIDDLIITSDEPSAIDANGNSFIGVDSSLSTNEEIFNNTISITPNPTANIFTIDLGNEILEKVIIYNQLGQKTKEIPIVSETNQVDVSNLSNGIYFVKITFQSGKTATKKIIKN